MFSGHEANAPWTRLDGDQVRLQQRGCGLNAWGQAGEGNHRDVVVLPEGDCGFGGLLCIWPSSDQRSQTLEAEEFAGCVARFQQSVGIKSEPVAMARRRKIFS